MNRSLLELADRLGARAEVPGEARVHGFATDSSAVMEGDLFLAIRGARFDGHDFVNDARENGALAAIVERPVDIPYLLVDDLAQALARMAGTIRETYEGPVVGITGSAGKTSTKEFVSAALAPLGDVLKTTGNRNTEWTSPLLWPELEPTHRAVVVEMAMRGFGQIRHLASFSRPTIGVVTNIGTSHMEMVGSRAGIAEAKGELIEALPDDGWALLWQEDDFLETLKKRAGARRVRTFGFSEGADCRITRYDPIDWSSSAVSGTNDGHAWEARIPAVGRHMALNAAAAVLAATLAGVHPAVAAAALEFASLPPMRMEVFEKNGAQILLDNYNAAPASMLAAIETLGELSVTGRRRAVIGEMRELGEHTEAAHRSVGTALAAQGIDEVIFLGAPTAHAREAALAAGADPNRFTQGHSIEEVRTFILQAKPGDVVLIKGSRALELERALD